MSGSYILEKDGLLRQEMLRNSHRKVAHLENTEKDFVKYCESASKITKAYFATKFSKYKERKIWKKRVSLEEENFQLAVRNGLSGQPIDVLFIEDIEAGLVLFYDDSRETQDERHASKNDQKTLQPELLVSRKSIEVSEFFPEGYCLKAHKKVDINLALRRLKFRATKLAKSQVILPKSRRQGVREDKRKVKNNEVSSSSSSEFDSSSSSDSDSVCSCSESNCGNSDSSVCYSSSSEDEDVEYNPKIFKDIYNLKTQIGDTIIQRRFNLIKSRQHIKNDEDWFYRKVCEVTETYKLQSAPRFKEIEGPENYIRWVTGNYLPSPLDTQEIKLTDQASGFEKDAILNLMSPTSNNINDFHRAIAFTKKAKIYTKEDFKNKNVIFGGSKKSCTFKRKAYPFQDEIYVSHNIRGEQMHGGLEERKVNVTIPTISLLPHLHANLKLKFK